jgi:hypothetical protein
MEQAFREAFESQQDGVADGEGDLLRVVFYTPGTEDFARAIPSVGGEHVWTFGVTAEAWRFILYCMQHLQLELGAPVDQVLIATQGDAGYFSTVPEFVVPNDPTNIGGVSGNQTPASFGGKAAMFMSAGGDFTLLTKQFASSATYSGGDDVDGKTVMQALADAIGGDVLACDHPLQLNDDGTATTQGAQWLATHGHTAPSLLVPAPPSGSAAVLLAPQS